MRLFWQGQYPGSPHLQRLMLNESDLQKELSSVPTNDLATQLVLESLGADLIEEEGLYSVEELDELLAGELAPIFFSEEDEE